VNEMVTISISSHIWDFCSL